VIGYALRYEGKLATTFTASCDQAAMATAAVWIEADVVFARQVISGRQIECIGLRFEVVRLAA